MEAGRLDEAVSLLFTVTDDTLLGDEPGREQIQAQGDPGLSVPKEGT